MATKCDSSGSPRVFKADHMLYTNPATDINDAMKLAGYTRREISCRHIRKSISKKKRRLQVVNMTGKEKIINNKTTTATVVTSSTSKSNISDLINSSSSSRGVSSRSSNIKCSKPFIASVRKHVQPRKNAFQKF